MDSPCESIVFALPTKVLGQKLHEYVRERLSKFEQALFAGLPYTVITDAVRAAGFTGTSVHTVEQAVYRARKYGRAKPTVNRDPRPRFGAPTGLPSPSSQVPRDSMNEDMKRISRRLRELSRPPRPGEPDPLN